MDNVTILNDVWKKNGNYISTIPVNYKGISIDELLASLFCAGPFYYYVVDFHSRQIAYIHPAVKDVLGLDPGSVNFNDIIDLIHPDDMDHVALAESTVLNFLYENLGKENVTMYKMSYCFRFKIADGSYNLFQHQAILLSQNNNGSFAHSLNVHTNISHLTTENNYKAFVTGLYNNERYLFDIAVPQKSFPWSFTTREWEIIRLIAKGKTNEQMAAVLNISINTLKNHRKNILGKAGIKSTAELIAICIQHRLL